MQPRPMTTAEKIAALAAIGVLTLWQGHGVFEGVMKNGGRVISNTARTIDELLDVLLADAQLI